MSWLAPPLRSIPVTQRMKRTGQSPSTISGPSARPSVRSMTRSTTLQFGRRFAFPLCADSLGALPLDARGPDRRIVLRDRLEFGEDFPRMLRHLASEVLFQKSL